MNTPPICNYEGSDYQTSFWEKGGRAYEDAVEEKALKKLLPESGKLMLELGAGAGRNTPRYKNYKKIVLLDYSRTQLEQARQQLGDSERYVYVAADVYHLPFVSGLFDGATMIRTLHHMADARMALEQVADVLQSKAVFILEYANKHNLKAILRYALKKQTWDPNAPEPVEFAALNFDFHPQTVKSWLQSLGFHTEKLLTVSHFRMALLKKVFPTKMLAWMDSMAQLTSNWWQLTPSIFTRNRLKNAKPQAVDGTFFRCPQCGAELEDTPPLLKCSCGQTYPFEDGIYDFRLMKE
ncbi:MAG: class I SAM-dependent methyltransferase [Anaerolineaceae bacterium]|nr:class I SAM-dependent methyltransferase [Anaerolineaceae bacterium]